MSGILPALVIVAGSQLVPPLLVVVLLVPFALLDRKGQR